jgi:hypothetical protein
MIMNVGIQKRLQLSGILILLGLVAELISLFWNHPMAFLFFVFVGGLLIVVGITVYLFSLIA